jgi:hypothetical protein
MTLTEVAAKIDAYLKKFEADPKINVKLDSRTISPYWQAGAYQVGRFVGIIYVRFQGSFHLKRDEAEKYLAWLDAGNVGKHLRLEK